jgi:oligopeptide transport system ATP-binding protein
MALMLITHDIGVVAEVAERVVVMYAGRVMEQGPTEQVCSSPAHPYTRALLDSVPRPGLRGRPLPMIQGSPPDPLNRPTGCPFSPRCAYTTARCAEDVPQPHDVDAGHTSACHKWELS